MRVTIVRVTPDNVRVPPGGYVLQMVYVFSIDIVLEKFTLVLSVSEFDFSKEKNPQPSRTARKC